jgi:hypothetical protein
MEAKKRFEEINSEREPTAVRVSERQERGRKRGRQREKKRGAHLANLSRRRAGY